MTKKKDPYKWRKIIAGAMAAVTAGATIALGAFA